GKQSDASAGAGLSAGREWKVRQAIEALHAARRRQERGCGLALRYAESPQADQNELHRQGRGSALHLSRRQLRLCRIVAVLGARAVPFTHRVILSPPSNPPIFGLTIFSTHF